MHIEDKLAILADAAKYDVSCASSGSRRSNSGRGLGNAAPCGICHTFTEDGRCVSLLKILYTNHCIYDCAYCVNRAGNDIRRAAFTPAEIVSLTIDFYRRNYIEGLFLSSGVMRNPDETMERLVRTVEALRKQGFNGYIHLKCVPFASRRLIRQAGLHSDRLSVNIELPSEASLKRLTLEKTYDSVLEPMGVIHESIAETREDRKRLKHAPTFSPAGQSTQLIIGASPESDFEILTLADRLYRGKSLKRVYYSAYMPVIREENRLPEIAEPPLVRENRLYQADWLIRLYGFSLDEVISPENPDLDQKMDPKQAFALRNPHLFPVDINTADREMILRVPGIGIRSANLIVGLRRKGRIRFEHLKQLGFVIARAQPFIRIDGMPPAQWLGGPADRRETPRSPGTREPRIVFETDGTFEGLLTAVFESFNGEQRPDAIEPGPDGQPGLFERRVRIASDPAKSERVWKGLKTFLGSKRRRKIFEAHLSGEFGVETAVYRVIRDMISAAKDRQAGADLASHIRLDKLSQKVRHEAHRMKGFVRFQRTAAGEYVALIAPRYDILPLIRRHFESRFTDQKWIICDTRRRYGLCSDRNRTRELKWEEVSQEFSYEDGDERERFCRDLWRRYYDAVNIPQRDNPRLHLRQLPRRYWRYLPEKNDPESIHLQGASRRP